MANPLEQWKGFKLSEAYEVVKAAVVVMEASTYRIEVFQSYWNPNDRFNTRTWIEKGGTWVLDADAPWTSRNDPDSALAQALGFLAERARKRAS